MFTRATTIAKTTKRVDVMVSPMEVDNEMAASLAPAGMKRKVSGESPKPGETPKKSNREKTTMKNAAKKNRLV